MKKKMSPKQNEGLVYSNVEIRPDRAYVLYVGDVKYIDTTHLLPERLVRKYEKPVEVINILPNLPPADMPGNVMVVNPDLKEYVSRNGGRYILPLDQADIDYYVSESPRVKEIVSKILKSQEDLYINVFKSTPNLTLVDGKRVHVIGPDPDLFEYFDDKLNQRKLAQQLRIPSPKSYVASSFDQLVHLYEKHFGGDAFVSCANGFGGNGSEKVSCVEGLYVSPKLRGREKFVLAELLDVESSPCSLGLAAEDGIFVVSVADQIMKNGVEYQGTVFPSTAGEDKIKEMTRQTERIGRRLSKSGYRGFFGVDFIIDKNGGVYFAEINPRKIGSTPENILAFKTAMPNKVSLSELELLAVTQGRLDVNPSQYPMPDLDWGVFSLKAGIGQKTTRGFNGKKTESQIFKEGGSVILDHPGREVEFLNSGRVARVVCVDQSREKVLENLEEKASLVESCLE